MKIVRLETNMANVGQKVDELKLSIHEISIKIDVLSQIHIKVEELEKEIKDIKSRNSLKAWLYPLLSYGAGAIITYLVMSYLNKLR